MFWYLNTGSFGPACSDIFNICRQVLLPGLLIFGMLSEAEVLIRLAPLTRPQVAALLFLMLAVIILPLWLCFSITSESLYPVMIAVCMCSHTCIKICE